MNLRATLPSWILLLSLAAAVTAPAGAGGSFQVPLITEAEPIELPPVTRHTLANGLELWVVERHEQPLALFQLVIPRGSLADPQGKEGLASFTAQLLRQGTESRSADEIAETIEFVGGSLAAGSGAERTVVTAQVLARDAGLALELLADVAIRPTFPEQELEIFRNQVLGALRQEKDNPPQLASAHSAAFFYGEEHPLGRRPTEASTLAITREDVAAFHQDHYGPRGAVLLAVGDLDPSWVAAQVEERFGAWQGPPAPAPVVADVPRLEESRIRWVARPGQTQVQIRLRQNGPARTAEDWLAVQVYNEILGSGGFASRLMQVVRSDLGQTYGIWTGYTTYRFPGAMELTTFTRNESLWATLEAIHHELQRFRAEGVTEEELAATKSHLLGSFPLRLETLGGTASLIADALFYEGTLETIRTYPQRVTALSRDQVNAAIDRYLDPERFAVVLLGDPALLDGAPPELFGVPTERVELVDWEAPVQGYTPAGD